MSVKLYGFEATETYLNKNIYPSCIIGDKGKKANFRKHRKPSTMLYEQLIHKNPRLVISSTERQHTIISDVHKGLGHDPKAKAIASHGGKVSATQEISNKFFWQNIRGDVKNLIRNVTNVSSKEN